MKSDPKDSIFAEMGFLPEKGARESAAIYALARTFNLMIRSFSALYKEYGLTAPSFNLLMLLKHGRDPQDFTQRELGLRLAVSPSDMSGLVDRLERKELVRRLPGKDRRSHLLKITLKGERLLDEIWPRHSDHILALTRGIPRADMDGLLRSLDRMRRTAEAMEAEPGGAGNG